MSRAIPKVLYSCCVKGCDEEVSYPPEDLNWCEALKGWICCHCYYPDDHGDIGETLAEHIARTAEKPSVIARARIVELEVQLDKHRLIGYVTTYADHKQIEFLIPLAKTTEGGAK